MVTLASRLENVGHLGPVPVGHLLNCLSVGGSRGLSDLQCSTDLNQPLIVGWLAILSQLPLATAGDLWWPAESRE